MTELLNIQEKVFKSLNWSAPLDNYTRTVYDQNLSQFWTDNDLRLGEDVPVWLTLPDEVKRLYTRVFAGLTLLDTRQSPGMSIMSIVTEDSMTQTLYAWMSAMEGIHASFYSAVFSTILSKDEITEAHEWVENQPELQAKIRIVEGYYRVVLLDYATNGKITDFKALYKAKCSSVLLESFLFYSGFYYPMYLGGKGLMLQSSLGISLIVRDEAVHGLTVGMKAMEIFNTFSQEEQDELESWLNETIEELMEIEYSYTEKLYAEVGLVEDVKTFLQYNADRALLNLGFDPKYEVEDRDINPIVLNGISTETFHADIFSAQNNGYVIPMQTEPLTEELVFVEVVDEFALIS